VDPRAGRGDEERRKMLTLPALEIQPLGRPARSQSLYRLRYPEKIVFNSACNSPFHFKNRQHEDAMKLISHGLIILTFFCIFLSLPATAGMVFEKG
jgi:hypothetical protein